MRKPPVLGDWHTHCVYPLYGFKKISWNNTFPFLSSTV